MTLRIEGGYIPSQHSIFCDDTPEYEHIDGDFKVWISKVGGGTLGRKYTGSWHIEVWAYDELLGWVIVKHDRAALHTGTPTDHIIAAQETLAFVKSDLTEAGVLIDA